MDDESLLRSTNFSHNWFHNVSDIEPGKSAVLSDNLLAFYGIHIIAICLIGTSLLSCSSVIISILCLSRRDRLDFSDRFPLYLAIADMLWGISHLTDHLVLLSTGTYPGTAVATALSINLWFFLGYQQLMHAGLATYTYLKIVRGLSLDLGKREWRLHVFCISLMGVSVAVFYPLGSFGCSGYWFLHNLHTAEGRALGYYIATSSTLQALCTTFGYRSIKKSVENLKVGMLNYGTSMTLTKPTYHSTATQCLTTFVFVSVGLYCPLALAYWAFVIQSQFGILDPLTVFFIVLVSNSSGWANALGYFYNKRIKARREREKGQFVGLPTFSSSSAK